MTHTDPDGERRDAELAHARELLARTVRFLRRCAEDPRSAMESEDPRALVRDLEDLAAEPKPADPSRVPAELPTIQIRRRRSA